METELSLLRSLAATVTLPPPGCSRVLDVDWSAAVEIKAKLAALPKTENVVVATKPKPSFAPTYAALYPAMAEIARKHGYAFAGGAWIYAA